MCDLMLKITLCIFQRTYRRAWEGFRVHESALLHLSCKDFVPCLRIYLSFSKSLLQMAFDISSHVWRDSDMVVKSKLNLKPCSFNNVDLLITYQELNPWKEGSVNRKCEIKSFEINEHFRVHSLLSVITMAGVKALITLAFTGALGLLFLILACALPQFRNWSPFWAWVNILPKNPYLTVENAQF